MLLGVLLFVFEVYVDRFVFFCLDSFEDEHRASCESLEFAQGKWNIRSYILLYALMQFILNFLYSVSFLVL